MRKTRPRFGPYSSGVEINAWEFDHAEFEEGWRYELINGVLVVSPTPLEAERAPNDKLGYWLQSYQETHPLGFNLDDTLPEQTVITRSSRRRADRVVWAGLGRPPTPDDPPTIIVEIVSKGKRDRERDYETKRDEYAAINVQQYWIIDRFRRTMTVFNGKGRKRVYHEKDVFTTPLLPGFKLPLARLFAVADRWAKPKGKR
jgi:Uma2 family endonuclease